MLLPQLRSVVVTWPAVPGKVWQTRVHDADTKEDISPMVLRITVVVDPCESVLADLLMITDPDGNPSNKTFLNPAGGYHQDTFRCLVAEMRVQEA
jgi:hypothetical protein